MKRRAFVAIGSNMGDRWAYLRLGVERLPDVVATSPVYETEPVGGPAGSGPFLNAVVELSTRLSPHDLLARAVIIETEAGRERLEANGPRTLDVDILMVGDDKIKDGTLEVPHPRMWDRRFVVAPLKDLAPELVSSQDLSRAIGSVRQVGNLS